MKTKCPEPKKIQIVRLYEQGKSVLSLSQKYKVSKSAIYNWIKLYKQFHSAGEDVTTIRQNYLYQKRIERLERENTILRLSGCTLLSPRKERLQAIEQLQETHSIHSLCKVLGINRATFYNHRKKEETWFQKEEEMLKPMIQQIFEDSKCRYGSKKIRAMLLREGVRVSKERVTRLMHDMGLDHTYKKPKRIYSKENRDKRLENKLNREFTQTAPNRVWVSDISYIKISKSATFYICVIIDLFSRKVVSYQISDDCDSYLVIDTFKDAFIKRGKPDSLLFHSDRGSQYYAAEFRKQLWKYNVEQSFSNSGCPYDNAVVESFFAMMKKEEIYRNEYESFFQLKKAIEEYVHFYNNQRIHESLNYLTPNEVECQYSA